MIELILQRLELVSVIESIPEPVEIPGMPLRLTPPERKRAAFARKLEAFDAEHPEVAAAMAEWQTQQV